MVFVSCPGYPYLGFCSFCLLGLHGGFLGEPCFFCQSFLFKTCPFCFFGFFFQVPDLACLFIDFEIWYTCALNDSSSSSTERACRMIPLHKAASSS